LGSQENKKYNFEYYPNNNNNNTNNNLTLENTSINNIYTNKSNYDINFQNDRNASPCFSNMDKYTGINNNHSNLYNQNYENIRSSEDRRNDGHDYDNLNYNIQRKDTGMSFRKTTDRENIFKNNYNSSNNQINNLDLEGHINNKLNYNHKKSLNINIQDTDNNEYNDNKSNNYNHDYNKNDIGDEYNENIGNDQYYNKRNYKEGNNSNISNDNKSKNSNNNKNSMKFTNLVNYKKEKANLDDKSNLSNINVNRNVHFHFLLI